MNTKWFWFFMSIGWAAGYIWFVIQNDMRIEYLAMAFANYALYKIEQKTEGS